MPTLVTPEQVKQMKKVIKAAIKVSELDIHLEGAEFEVMDDLDTELDKLEEIENAKTD